MDLRDCDFLLENELIEIIPKFNEPPLELICGSFGPFEAGIPVQAPIWLAMFFRRQQKCVITPPEWLNPDELKKLATMEVENKAFTFLPNRFFELSRMLITKCPGDFENVDEIRTLVKDIWDIRKAKRTTSMDVFLQKPSSHAQMNNITQLEIADMRPFMTMVSNVVQILCDLVHGTAALKKTAKNANYVQVSQDYYDIDHLLSTVSTISTTFAPSTSDEFFQLIGQKAPEVIPEKGFKTEAPAWIMCALNNVAVSYQSQLPKLYTEKQLQGLAAKPEETNLERQNYHFYQFGMQLAARLDGSGGRELAERLLEIFLKRARWILKLTVDPDMKPLKLDALEKALFLVGQKSEQLIRQWFRNPDQKTTRKRKHVV